MQDQLFATLRDAGTGATIPTVFAWSSETPGIATVDQDGVITAVSAGTAVFRATATDGTTNTYSLPMHVATASQTAQYGHNTEFGEPTDADASDDHILRYSQFTSSFNRNRNTPNWVSYNIDATHFGAEDRCDCFTYDTALPADFPSYTTAAYTGAGRSTATASTAATWPARSTARPGAWTTRARTTSATSSRRPRTTTRAPGR
jgi:hypothetical protein